MGESRRIRLPLRRVVVAIGVALVATGAGTVLAASPTPTPDPAPVSTTTTTTRVTTTPTTKPAVSAPTTRTTTRVTTPPPTSPTKAVTKTVRHVKKPVVKVKPWVTHKPKAARPTHATTKPAIALVATTAVVVANADATSTGGHSGQLLLIVAALGLLALSLVPTRVVVDRIGLRPARAATVRVGLAIVGLSAVLGFLIAQILGNTA